MHRRSSYGVTAYFCIFCIFCAYLCIYKFARRSSRQTWSLILAAQATLRLRLGTPRPCRESRSGGSWFDSSSSRATLEALRQLRLDWQTWVRVWVFGTKFHSEAALITYKTFCSLCFFNTSNIQWTRDAAQARYSLLYYLQPNLESNRGKIDAPKRRISPMGSLRPRDLSSNRNDCHKSIRSMQLYISISRDSLASQWVISVVLVQCRNWQTRPFHEVKHFLETTVENSFGVLILCRCRGALLRHKNSSRLSSTFPSPT